MKAKSFDKKFDEGEDVTEYLDLSTARRPNKDQKRVNVDFPTWMVESLDREASRVGVTKAVNYQGVAGGKAREVEF